VEYFANTPENPFGMTPPCESFVSGYGSTWADFHVVGDHPGVHGGELTGIPFTDRPWSAQFFDVLERADLIERTDLDSGEVTSDLTYLSYLHMCDPGEGPPDEDDYAALEPFFDAELRAITAHVLLPVGRRPIQHVLDTYTARSDGADVDLDALHGTEIQGSGWLVVPIKDPAEWTGDDPDRLVSGLTTLQETDYRQASDLGRFFPGEDPYLVR
jgi:uracil-DNA glycosylase